MPLPAWAVSAGIQGGIAGLRYLTRPKRKSFGETEFGRKLKKRSEEGYLSPKARRRIVGAAGVEAGAVAQRNTAKLRGILEAGGIGVKSVAAVRTLGEPAREQMKTVTKVRKDVELENELSKIEAKSEYDRLMFGDLSQRQAEERQARAELMGGIAGAVAGGYEGKLREKELEIYKTREERLADYYKPGEKTLDQTIDMHLMDYFAGTANPEQIQFLENANVINKQKNYDQLLSEYKRAWLTGEDLPEGMSMGRLDNIMMDLGVKKKPEAGKKEPTELDKLGEEVERMKLQKEKRKLSGEDMRTPLQRQEDTLREIEIQNKIDIGTGKAAPPITDEDTKYYQSRFDRYSDRIRDELKLGEEEIAGYEDKVYYQTLMKMCNDKSITESETKMMVLLGEAIDLVGHYYREDIESASSVIESMKEANDKPRAIIKFLETILH